MNSKMVSDWFGVIAWFGMAVSATCAIVPGYAMLHDSSAEVNYGSSGGSSSSRGVDSSAPADRRTISVGGVVSSVPIGLFGETQENFLRSFTTQEENARARQLEEREQELKAGLQDLFGGVGGSCTNKENSRRLILEHYYEEKRNEVIKLLGREDPPEIEVVATLSLLEDVAGELGLGR